MNSMLDHDFRDLTVNTLLWAALGYQPGCMMRVGADALVDKLRLPTTSLVGGGGAACLHTLQAYCRADCGANAQRHLTPGLVPDAGPACFGHHVAIGAFARTHTVYTAQLRWVLQARVYEGDLADQVARLLAACGDVEQAIAQSIPAMAA